MTFDLLLQEGFERLQQLQELAKDAILAADRFVFIFHSSAGTLQAVLKNFLERVLRPDLVE
jgi:hypothetical protein